MCVHVRVCVCVHVLYSVLISIYSMLIGILGNTPVGEMRAYAMILMSALDLPARAIVANMKQFNSKHGCVYCEDVGINPEENPLVRCWPKLPCSVKRYHSSIMNSAINATLKHEAVSSPIYIYTLHV